MALHPEFPKSPYAELLPDQRWFPAAEELRSTAYEKLLPPLVAKIRGEVSAWRAAGYAGASDTSRSLLNWWFETEHLVEQADGTLSPFRYYFAQREAVETVIWLHDVRKVRDKFDLLSRLHQWCADATSASQAEGGSAYRFVYVDQQGYERNPPSNFTGLVASFTEYQS